MEIRYVPIGVVRSPFTDLADMPIQPRGRASAPGTVVVRPEFAEGLRDLDGFSHVILLYHLHRVERTDLTVTPFLGSGSHGVFATRAPTRPNPIGLSVVELLGVEGNVLRVAGIDVLDGTPVLDVKPHVPEFDCPGGARVGWLAHAHGRSATTTSDRRFAGPGA
jgi:tRNA-Thr(GGU) m(6)t(6)A37 methyltransferase TsaA